MSEQMLVQVARAYIERGWKPVPIPPREKGPRLKGWQTLRLTAEEAPRYFTAGMNLGVILGEPSGWLVDVDLDCPEALRVADAFLPSTPAKFGRASKPRSHWLYVAEPGLVSKKYVDPNGGATLVELRSTGGQTVFPPSVHKSGERVAWDEGSRKQEAGRSKQEAGEETSSFLLPPSSLPASCSSSDLQTAVGQLAVVCLLARYWPKQGSRNDAALALAGALLRAGWELTWVEHFIEHVALAAGDEEVCQRTGVVHATAQKMQAGENVTGWTRLSELIGEPVVRLAREWLGMPVARPTSLAQAHTSMVSPPGVSQTGGDESDWETVHLDQVVPRPVDWLWTGWMPRGKLVMLDGDPAQGKSTVSLDLVARYSRGRAWPDGAAGGPPGTSLIITAEDDWETTVVPRLIAAEADLTRVKGVNPNAFVGGNLAMLQRRIEEYAVGLVVIDVLASFLTPDINPYLDHDVRGKALKPLTELAHATGATLLILRHLTKSGNDKAITRGNGSVGIIGNARAGLLIAPDPRDPSGERRVLAVNKTNLSRKSASLVYRLVDHGGTGRVVWEGTAPISADQLLAEVSQEERSARGEARAFLREFLADGPKPTKEVEAEAQERGISQATFKRARLDLGVEAFRPGYQSPVHLRLPILAHPTQSSSSLGDTPVPPRHEPD